MIFMMQIITFVVGIWLLCGCIAYGLTLGDFTKQFPYGKHHEIANFMFIGGPIGLLVAFLDNPFRDFRLQHLSDDERWAKFQAAHPSLGREWFERI